MNAISANNSCHAAQLLSAATTHKPAQGQPESPSATGSKFSPSQALHDAQPITGIILHVKPKGTGTSNGVFSREGKSASFSAEGTERSVTKTLDILKHITNTILHRPVEAGKPPATAQSAAQSCGDVPFFTAADIGSTWCGKLIKPAVLQSSQAAID